MTAFAFMQPYKLLFLIFLLKLLRGVNHYLALFYEFKLFIDLHQ